MSLTNYLDFTKTIIPLALVASESIAHDSEPIRARGIIVNYAYAQSTSLTQALNPLRRCNLVIAQKEVPLILDSPFSCSCSQK